MQTRNALAKALDTPREEHVGHNSDAFIGVLDVFVHQARDINNICIYHKQDVYAKLCMTNDPETTVCTKIINGGGRDPVFNDKVQLNIAELDSSLKCEIFMMSRVRNYLEDQLLGLALVPLSEVVINNDKLEGEFSLSSTDLFHSPAGFVQLSLSLAYNSASPDIIAIPKRIVQNPEASESQEAVPHELDKIEFPDPQIANENQIMVSQYIEIVCPNLEPSTTETLLTKSDSENHPTEEFVKLDIPATCDPTTRASSLLIDAVSEASDSPTTAVKASTHEQKLSQEEKISGEIADNERKVVKPLITVKVEQEQNVVQQDIVDMYMKSMQQFTESLAKMKLPLDIDNGPSSSGSSGSSGSDRKNQDASKNSGSRVFYGSRAFF